MPAWCETLIELGQITTFPCIPTLRLIFRKSKRRTARLDIVELRTPRRRPVEPLHDLDDGPDHVSCAWILGLRRLRGSAERVFERLRAHVRDAPVPKNPVVLSMVDAHGLDV